MSAIATVPIKDKPGIPMPVSSGARKLYKLYFKKGSNPRCEIIFELPGTLVDAINRGRDHCVKMNYKFIHVEQYLLDLDAVERNFSGE